LEYGIVLERNLPTFMNQVVFKLEKVYIPRTVAVWRWIPLINRYIPQSFLDLYAQSKRQFDNSEIKSQLSKGINESIKNPNKLYEVTSNQSGEGRTAHKFDETNVSESGAEFEMKYVFSDGEEHEDSHFFDEDSRKTGVAPN
jgi:hypothetical protein